MSDRTAECGIAVWIALRRAHQGGVSNLAGSWLYSGHRVPGYLADVLDELINAGLLALGEVDLTACGVRRVTVTDAGCARYLALCKIHNPQGQAAVITPHRWAHSPRDQRSHLLAEPGTDQIGSLVGACGHRMLRSVPTSAQPSGRPCPTCQALPDVPIPARQFGNPPDSGRQGTVTHAENPVQGGGCGGGSHAVAGVDHRGPGGAHGGLRHPGQFDTDRGVR